MKALASFTGIRSSLTRSTRPVAALVAMAFWAVASAAMGADSRAPEVPADLVVEEGHQVSFHAYAVGVQIYVATSGAKRKSLVWTFKGPEAVLLDDDGNPVGVHYAGPTWESESGSKVVGAFKAGVTVDPTAIPWLLLSVRSTEGPGVFEGTTFVQRVHTTGGLMPTTPPSALGEEKRVPYTADYYFFRESP